MGYQEILIKSSKMSIEHIADIIQRKRDPTYIDQANTIATLRNDFNSKTMFIFGMQVDTEPLEFKAGEKFLVVCGDRDALRNIKAMFPVLQRKSIEVYPMERVMQSDQCVNKAYEDVFDDSRIASEKNMSNNRRSVLKNLHYKQDEISQQKIAGQRDMGKSDRGMER